jgi:hypothetical protein
MGTPPSGGSCAQTAKQSADPAIARALCSGSSDVHVGNDEELIGGMIPLEHLGEGRTAARVTPRFLSVPRQESNLLTGG